MRSGFCVLAMLTVVFCVPVLAYDFSTNPGAGEPNDPYQISEPNHLMSIGIDPNLMDNYFVLTADLDMSEYSGTQYNIIGNITTPFTGGFDGNSHIISNFTHASYDQSDVGLFGVIGQESAIEPNVLAPYVRNVTLVDPNITTGGLAVGYTGAIAAVLRQGSIEHCSVSGGRITGRHSMGAIAGAVIDEGSVKHCIVSGSDISGTFSIGGIAGYYTSSGNIDSCGYSGDVAGTNYVGGIIGEFRGDTIRNCCSKGTVTGNYSIGGLVGYVGFDCNILNNYSQANVLSEGVSSTAGGLVGTVGGGSYFSRCYAAGGISSDDDIGGFIGIEHNSTDYNDCFWDIEKNPLLDDVGNVGDVTEITGESTDNMQTQGTFSNWDFVGESVNGENDIWRLCESEPNYPRLSWEFARNGDFACDDGVDIFDLQALAQNWLTAADSLPTEFNYACDANGDGKIDFLDYAVLGKNW